MLGLAVSLASITIPTTGAFADETAPAISTKAASASGSDLEDLAKELNNPVASLISVPFQNNWDFGGGPNNHGFQYKLNIQPVVPISLCEDWNVISRTILPYIHQDDIIGNTSQGGLSDTTESLFFSPKNPGPGGLIWGLGPIFYLPTATESVLGAGKWGVGPTAVLLWQKGGWTYGALASQVWSFSGSENRSRVSSTFLQPFLAYTTKKQTTFTLNSETTYDWVREQATVPFNAMVSQLVKIGKLPVNFQVGARYYADKPPGGPDWGLRFTVTLLFPKK